MFEIIIGNKNQLFDIVRLRLQIHKESSRYDPDIVISESNQKEIEEQTRQELEDPRLIFLLAKENQEIIGLAILSISPKTDKTAFLGELFVEEKRRGRGIGTLLLNKAIETAQKNNLKFFRVTVARNNKQALKFYDKKKFKEVERNYLLFEKEI